MVAIDKTKPTIEKSYRSLVVAIDEKDSLGQCMAYDLCYHSARLQNQTLYNIRQHYFKTHKTLSEKLNYHLLKTQENYKLLMTDHGQQMIKLTHRDMKSFFELLKLKKQGEYHEKVKLPKYKDKEGITTAIIFGRTIRNKKKDKNFIVIPLSKQMKNTKGYDEDGIKLKVPSFIKQSNINEVKIVPVINHDNITYECHITYEVTLEKAFKDNGRYLSIDLGLNNLVTAFDGVNGQSFIIDGKYIKSINQNFNKNLARLKSESEHLLNKFLKTKERSYLAKRTFVKMKIAQLYKKRQRKIKDFMHKTTKLLICYAKERRLNTLVVGYNKKQKQNINIGKKNNQHFVSIPFSMFRSYLKDKCESMRLCYQEQEESYTSKCSFLDKESVRKHDQYVGKRTRRGLFKSSDNVFINADSNGAANILMKHLKSKGTQQKWYRTYFEKASKGIVNYPVRLSYSLFTKANAFEIIVNTLISKTKSSVL